jgi:hypothetical protein
VIYEKENGKWFAKDKQTKEVLTQLVCNCGNPSFHLFTNECMKNNNEVILSCLSCSKDWKMFFIYFSDCEVSS